MTEPTRHGPWQILSRGEVYRDPWIEVTRDEVIRPDGAPGSHCIVRLKAGVSVLALDAEGMVYLTEEFHYGVGRTTIEAVSGGMDAGEDALAAAQRELQEELGITAGEWTDLGVCDPFTSVVVSPTRLFLARSLTLRPHGAGRHRANPLPQDAVRRGGANGPRQPHHARPELRVDSQDRHAVALIRPRSFPVRRRSSCATAVAAVLCIVTPCSMSHDQRLYRKRVRPASRSRFRPGSIDPPQGRLKRNTARQAWTSQQ